MEDPKIKQWKRIVAHKRKKEKLRQQQQIIDALMKEPENKWGVVRMHGPPISYSVTIPLTIGVMRNSNIIDWEQTT